jgi:hypothetical protein
MKWILPNGKEKWKNDTKYRINFDKPSLSNEQFRVKQFLKKYCSSHIMYEEYTIPGTILKIDFLNLTQKWALEHQGVGHFSYNSYFHRGSRLNYLKSIKNDSKKRQILELNGFLVIETITEDLDYLSHDYFFKKFGVNL